MTEVRSGDLSQVAGLAERAPGRLWFGKAIRHEWVVVSLAALLLAVLFTWPTLRDPAHTVPQDIIDPTFEASQISWGGHALLTDPGRLWSANDFYPEWYSYAFTDTLLGYAPLGMIGSGPAAALVRYNIIFVLAHALAFVGAYALVRQLGAGRAGGALAGAAFTYAPWLIAHAGHMNIISNGAIPLSLAMLARGHGWSLRDGYRPDRRRPGWALAGWAVATWQITIGFSLGLVFGYILGGCCLVALGGYGWSWWRRKARPPFGGRLLAADLGGGVLFGVVTWVMAWPYFEITKLHDYGERTLADVAQFSVPLRGFLVAPQESWLWGDAQAGVRSTLSWPPEMTHLPGFALIFFAIFGLFFSAWRPLHRLMLALGVAVTVVLGMGTNFLGDGDPGYVTLYRILPGWNALRTPGRFVFWTTLLLAILAAGLVTEISRGAGKLIADGWPGGEKRPSPLAARAILSLAVLIPVALVLVEGINKTPHPEVPQRPAAMADIAGPLLVLPLGTAYDDVTVLWVTDKHTKIVNGLASFTSRKQDEIRNATASFPDTASVAYLRGIGVRTVVLIPEWSGDTPWAEAVNRPSDGLGISRQQTGNTVVYRLG